MKNRSPYPGPGGGGVEKVRSSPYFSLGDGRNLTSKVTLRNLRETLTSACDSEALATTLRYENRERINCSTPPRICRGFDEQLLSLGRLDGPCKQYAFFYVFWPGPREFRGLPGGPQRPSVGVLGTSGALPEAPPRTKAKQL